MPHQLEASSQGVSHKMRFIAQRHDRLETVEGTWRQFEAAGSTTAFQRFDWMKGIATYLSGPAKGRPFVVEVRDAFTGQSFLLLPLILIQKFGHRVIEYLSLGVCDISLPIVAPGHVFSEEEGTSLWQAIVAVLPKADLINIGRIPRVMGGTVNPLAMLPCVYPIAMEGFAVKLNGDPSTIVDRITNGQTRRILKTSKRRLEELGPVRLMVADTDADLGALLTVMISQRLERFRQLDRFDPLGVPHVQEFYKAAAFAGLKGENPARAFGLAVGDETIATAYGLVNGDTFHLIILSMADGIWRSCSPGTAIVAQLIRWAREERFTTMDFSIGELTYKKGFGGQASALYALERPFTVRGKAVIALRTRFDEFKRKLKSNRLLWTGLKSIISGLRR
ncbi:GNAT family N-acetyltransferase [Neorhizobium lilium]|nr:GNAT family N-acetyltransferase [Neorhizobium lilium]